MMSKMLSAREIHLLLAEGQTADARAALTRNIAADDGFFLYHELLGDACAAEGDVQAAAESWLRALALDPQADWIQRKLAALGVVTPGAAAPSALAGPDQRAPDLASDLAPATATAAAPEGPAPFVGIHDRAPDVTGRRQAEGGLRLAGQMKTSQPGLPLVTIVTAVYDNAATLQRCIDSVLAQDYPNVEYIVIDGGSPQAVLDILARNADRIDYYVSEPDGGIYAAMNKGFSLARGDYLCILNSDDMHDPAFVRRSVETALEAAGQVDVVYSDFYDGGTRLAAQPMDAGIMLGNLNINHATFLVRRDCYETVGPYSTELKILSDMVWMRRAWQMGKRFVLMSEAYFRFSHGGASSGNSPERRKRIIAENGECYRRDFPFLTQEQAETLYLLRFSPDRLPAVIAIAKAHAAESGFITALARYLEHCFRDRTAFHLPHTEASGKFLTLIEAAELTGADKRHIHIATARGNFAEILGRIADLPRKPARPGAKRVLHYVTVFSAPSETFIHDLVTRLETETAHDNVVLFQTPQMREARPYAKAIEMSWPHFRPEVAQEIYRYLVKRLEIDVMIAHFAINEHRLHERIAASGVSLPTIVMTHGIDVFKLKEPGPYRDHVVDGLGARPDVAFTAVSDYLRRELAGAGVPADRITVLPNTVNDRFFRHRKTAGFHDGTRPVQLLSIGRLIDWKGHRFLIEALALLRDRAAPPVHLTIVCGNGLDEMAALQARIADLGVSDRVTLTPFVDFAADPGYPARFDLYVHPSTYSADAARKSETFGVAVLEAVAAGLPVITTDAGGLPEVIGTPGPHGRIVPHGNAAALADAIAAACADPATFTDNLAYARDRLAAFAPAQQIATLSRLMHQVTGTTVSAALFSSATTQGAGYAAYRVHRGLLRTSVKPTIFTTIRAHQKEPGVHFIAHPSGDGNRWRTMQPKQKPGMTIFTVNQTSVPSRDLLRLTEDHDIIALHFHARFLSAENIASLTRLNKPVVMTIRDMQPLTGGCHFFHGCEGWQRDCGDCPQIPSAFTDYPRKLVQAKRQHYDFSNLTLVTISNHTRSIVARTPAFRDCRIETIPNSIETEVFRPFDKATVRRELGLPLDRQIIGYVPSFSSEVKGYREIMQAFDRVKGRLAQDPFVMLVGGDTPASREIGFDKKTLGYIADNAKLARAYAAADVVVVPSLEETFSNTTAEAISCGVPVVGFRTGAIPDLAVDGVTGYTYPVGDVAGLAEGIVRVLTGPDMGPACRRHAEATLSFMTQARRYEDLFHELVARNRRADPAPRVFDLFEDSGLDQINIALELLAAERAPKPA